MKRLLLTAAAILATLNTYGQGQGIVTFNTTGQPDGNRIWVNDTGRAGDGVRAGGGAQGYSVALYWGAATETDDRNLTQIGGSTALLGTTGGAGTTAAGTFFGSGRTITTSGSTVNGPVLSFQVRGWSTAGGTTYEQVVLRGDPAFSAGKGPIFTLKSKDPLNNLETSPNVWQGVGFTGFGLTPVPEPSVIGLGLLGVGALLMLRRRK
jgi:MYXO-CTERM domain-containing protein